MELYGIHFEGNFSRMIRFDRESTQSTIGLSRLIVAIQKLTGFKTLGMVMLAESGGLIGTSLNVPPAEGKTIFTYPEIKNNICLVELDRFCISGNRSFKIYYLSIGK